MRVVGVHPALSRVFFINTFAYNGVVNMSSKLNFICNKFSALLVGIHHTIMISIHHFLNNAFHLLAYIEYWSFDMCLDHSIRPQTKVQKYCRPRFFIQKNTYFQLISKHVSGSRLPICKLMSVYIDLFADTLKCSENT